jgi:hypothetical protein
MVLCLMVPNVIILGGLVALWPTRNATSHVRVRYLVRTYRKPEIDDRLILNLTVALNLLRPYLMSLGGLISLWPTHT